MEYSTLLQLMPGRLRELRADITQTQMAAVARVSRGAYQAYEEGRALPQLATLFALRDYFGFRSLDDLIGAGKNERQVDKINDAYLRAPDKIKKAVDVLLG